MTVPSSDAVASTPAAPQQAPPPKAEFGLTNKKTKSNTKERGENIARTFGRMPPHRIDVRVVRVPNGADDAPLVGAAALGGCVLHDVQVVVATCRRHGAGARLVPVHRVQGTRRHVLQGALAAPGLRAERAPPPQGAVLAAGDCAEMK